MDAQSITAPEILTLFRSMDDYNRHRVLQLLIAEFSYAENEADLFLSQAAFELHRTDEHAQDNLYPMGRLTMEAGRRHRIERSVRAAERYAAGRAAMLAPVIRLSDNSVIA